MCASVIIRRAPKLTHSFGNCRRGSSEMHVSLKSCRLFFKVCICVGAPETEYNAPNPKSVAFIIFL